MSVKIRILFVLSLLVFQFAEAGNCENYNQAWKFFNQNNRIEARKFFNLAVNEPECKADAYLGLCLLDWNENKNSAAYANFMNFFNTSSNPYPYLYAISSLEFFRDDEVMKTPENLAFIEKIVLDPKMNGTLKAMMYEKLGTYYRNKNNFKKSNANYSLMGVVSNWQVLGTFNNTSGSGFSKDWGAVEKAKETDVFTNHVDAEVHWFTPPYNKENNWFMFDYNFDIDNAIMYAQTFVISAADQEVYMRTGTSGSLKVWINDGLVASVPEERNCDLDIYAYKVKLNQGVNRVLVQIGSSEIDRANFLMRFTDENANPLNNITSSAAYADYKKAAGDSSCEQLQFFAEKYFEDKVSQEDNNPLNYLLLAETYLRNDKAYEATKTLKKLEEKSGKSTVISYLLYEAYTRENNQTDYEKEMEAIKSTDPESYFSLTNKYAEAVKSEKYDEAGTLLNKMIELYGENAVTDGLKLAMASFQKKYEEVVSLGQSLYKKYPDNVKLMQLNYTIMKEVYKNPIGAIALIKKFCKTNYDEDALTLLYKELFDQGNSAEGLKVLDDLLNKNPYATGYIDNIINTYFQMQQYSAAIPYAEKGLKMAPYLPYFHNSLGSIYKNLNIKDKAKECFKKAIYYAPTSYDSRNQLRLLEEKKEIFELFPKTVLNELIAKAPGAKEYPEDNSMFLLNSFQQVVYPEGAKEFRREIAIKILKQSGIERWKEYGIGYNGYTQKLFIDKAEVIKANGSISKAETDDDNQVVFTNLEVNDVLHLEYRIQDFSKGKLASQFFDKFLLQYSIPSVKTQYSLLVPDDKKFNFKVTNGDVSPEITTIENMKLYKWEVNNMPAVKNENDMGSFMDVAPTLHYSSIPDWEYVSNWYKDITTSKFKSDFVLKETFSNIMKGHENESQENKARLIYQYILENISYSSVDFLQSNFIPQKASRTITTRLGDCKDLSTLFVALCREAGIDANLVLILTRDNGYQSLALPEVGFNHCIAQLNLNSKIYYLELTDNYLPFGAAVKQDLKANILPIPFNNNIKSDKLLSLEMPHRIVNGSVRTHNISFPNNNDMKIEREVAFTGLMASFERSEFKNLGADEQLKSKSESVAKQFKVASKMTDLSFKGLDTLSDTVHVNYKLEVKNAMQDVAGLKIFTLPWTDINSLDIVNLETRTYPMEYWEYQVEDHTTEQIVINLPAGKKLAESPVNINYKCPTATYSVTYDTSKPGKVIITRVFVRTQDQIKTEDYPAFKEFLTKVSECDNKQIAIK